MATGLLVLVALGYLAHRLVVYAPVLVERDYSWLVIGVLIAGVLIYGGISLTLPLAWRALLRIFGENKVSRRECAGIYGKAQIGKYVPGNVFHVAGRHLMGARVGLSHAALAASALLEVLAMVLAAAVIAMAGLGLYGLTAEFGPAAWAKGGVGLALMLVASVVIVVLCRRNAKWARVSLPTAQTLKQLGIGILFYFAYFIGVGAVLVALVAVFADALELRLIAVSATAFAAAWIGGFLTPGAPGGIGIREAILVVNLSGSLGEPDSLLVAILFRLVTTIGDALFFVIGAALASPTLVPDAEVNVKGMGADEPRQSQRAKASSPSFFPPAGKKSS